jgi:predicted acyl esterase
MDGLRRASMGFPQKRYLLTAVSSYPATVTRVWSLSELTLGTKCPHLLPLLPGRVERLTISLGDIHHTLRAGHRIEIDVTSSNFPRRARNTNSGHPVLASDSEASAKEERGRVYRIAESASP